jgi:hypothetical protein
VEYTKGNLKDRFVRTNMWALDMVISGGDKSDHDYPNLILHGNEKKREEILIINIVNNLTNNY